jgi:transcriptional regulator with XRE-family HTH domain
MAEWPVSPNHPMSGRDITWRHTLTPDLASALRRWRLRAGLTQRRLADRASCHRSTVTNLEAGRRAPSIALAVQLARVLNLNSVEYHRLLREAVRAGRSSPWVTGDWE